jgi:hypothetical protein
MGKEVSRVMDSMSRNIADAIVNGKSLSDTFVQVGKDIAKAILTLIIEQGLKELAKSLSGILDQCGAIGKAMESWAGVGTSAAGGAASSAGSSAGSAVGGSTGGGGNSGGGDDSGGTGLMGTIGVIAGVGTMISSIIGNFQNAHMETTLNAIEKSTRYTEIATVENGDWNLLINTGKVREFIGYLVDDTRGTGGIKELLSHIDFATYWTIKKLDSWDDGRFNNIAGLLAEIRDRIPVVSAAPANPFTININGAASPSDTGNAVMSALRAQGAFA